MGEDTKVCDTYGAAAKTACNHFKFDKPPDPKPPGWKSREAKDLGFYIGTMKHSEGKRLGVGLPGGSDMKGIPGDGVRLDYEPAQKFQGDPGKGIHFNARKYAGVNEDKLATIIKGTPNTEKTNKQRWEKKNKEVEAMYNKMIEALKGSNVPNAITLWNLWCAGKQPWSDDDEIALDIQNLEDDNGGEEA